MAVGIEKKNNVKITGNLSSGKTLMFGHGFGTDQTSFDEVIKPFLEDYRIILADNAGGGKSDIDSFNPLRYSSFNGYITDLLDICRHYDLADITYVGHSVTGMVSLMASQRAPKHFGKIILLGASPRYLNDAANGYVGGFEQPDLDGLFEAMNSNYYAWASGFSKVAMANEDKPQLAEKFAATLSAVRPDIALAVAKMIFQSDNRAELAKTTTPTLIVQTSNDVAVPTVVGDYLLANIPGSQLTKVKVEGHFPQISAPEEVIGAIKSFLN